MDFSDIQAKVKQGVLRDDLDDFYGDYVNEALREIQNRRSFVAMKQVVYLSVSPGVLGTGGNVVPVGAVWASGVGTLSFVITGFDIGAKYYYNPGNSSSVSADGINPISVLNGFFVATKVSYTLLAPASAALQAVTAAVITAAIDQVAVLPSNCKELQKRHAVHYVCDDGGLMPVELVEEWQQIHRNWAYGGCPPVTWPPRAFYERRSDTESVIGILEPLIQKFNFRVQYFGYLPDLVNDTDTSPIIDAYPRMVIAKAKAIAFSDINDPSEAQFEGEFEANRCFQTCISRSEVAGLKTSM